MSSEAGSIPIARHFRAARGRLPSPAMTSRRRALLRFFVLGAVLLAAWRGLAPAGGGEVVGGPAGAGGADEEVADEILYREALARGLDHEDAVVRRRLVQNVELVRPEAGGPAALPDEASVYREALRLGLDRTDT